MSLVQCLVVDEPQPEVELEDEDKKAFDEAMASVSPPARRPKRERRSGPG